MRESKAFNERQDNELSSLMRLRLFVLVWLTGRLTAEMGGSRFAQGLAALQIGCLAANTESTDRRGNYRVA